jgi:hypothetical protein
MTGSAFFNRDDVLASKGNAARFFLSELPDVCPFSLPKEIQRRGVGTKEQVKLLCDGPWTASLRGRYYVSCPALDLNLIKGFHRICNKTFLILRNLNLLLDFLGRLFVIIIYNDIFAPEFKKVEDIY